MLQGIGSTFLETTELGDLSAIAQQIILLGLLSFEYASEAEEKESQAFVDGVLRTASSAQGAVTDTLTLTYNEVNWQTLGLAYGKRAKTFANVDIPVLKTGTVPTTAPYEITDALITVANDAKVAIKAAIGERGAWGEPQSLSRAATPATPGVGEVGVDTTGTKLVFNAAQAGAPVSYTVPASYTTIEGYGGSGAANNLGRLQYLATVYVPASTDQWLIWFPQIDITSRPTITYNNDVPEVTVVAKPRVPAGWDEPFVMYNRDTGVFA